MNKPTDGLSRRSVLALPHGQRGAVLILVAIAAGLLIALVGLALDKAHVNTTTQQLQAASDAASLAAAGKLMSEITGDPDNPYTVTRNAAIVIAAANDAATIPVSLADNVANAADGDIVVGFWDDVDHTFAPETVSPNAVRVTARRTSDSADGPLDLFFGGAFGTATSDVARSSIAQVRRADNPFIIVLHPNKQGALSMTGTPVISVLPGSVHVNSSHNCAAKLTGTPNLIAYKLTTHGGACYPPGSISGAVVTDGPVLPDPLADVLPTVADWDALKVSMPTPPGVDPKVTSSVTLVPGYYPLGLEITANGTVVTLLPGNFMFGGRGISVGGGATLAGQPVTLFFDKGAILDMQGGANMDLRPPHSGPFEGITMFFHRESSGNEICTVGGNGIVNVLGTIYVPAGQAVMSGTSDKKIGQLIANLVDLGGNGTISGQLIAPPEGPLGVVLVQ